MFQIMEDFVDVVNRLKERQAQLNRELQHLDFEKEDICHFLTLQRYTGPEGAKLLKQLTATLRKRRAVKEEQRFIDNTFSQIPTRSTSYYIKGKENDRTYVFRTDAVANCFGSNYAKGKVISLCKKLKEELEKESTE